MNFFRFLSWLIEIDVRHYRAARKYEKSGVGYKIYKLIFLFLFSGVALGISYWAFSMLEDNFVFSLLAIIFLSIPFVGASIELNAVYSSYGIRRAVSGSLKTVIEKTSRKKRKDVEEFEFVEEPQRHTAIDVVIGILGAVFAVLTFVGFFLILYYFIQK